MCNQCLCSSEAHLAPRVNRRVLNGRSAVLAAIIAAWTASAVPNDLINIASAPVFLLSGAPPNLILTIDNSNSMNQASLPEGIWGPGGGDDPQLDARDISSLTNRQYYDPAQTYVPPLNADGRPRDHAKFDEALVDAFHSPYPSTCTLDLSKRFAPTWNLWSDGSLACADLRAASAAAIPNAYAADVGHPQYVGPSAGKNKVLHGQEWAWRCMVSTAEDCKAVYYRLKQDNTCKALDLATTKAVNFPIDCLERVEVGTADDLEAVTATVLAERARLLKDPNGTVPGPAALAERNFANWFSYYRTRFLTLKTVLSRVLNGFPNTVRFSYQGLPGPGQYTAGTPAFKDLQDRFQPYGDNQGNFFTWLFAQRANSKTNLVSAAARVHEFCRSDQAYLKNPRLALDATTNPLLGCRNNHHVMFTDGFWEDFIRVPGNFGGLAGLVTPTAPTGDAQLWLGNNDGSSTALPLNSAAVTTAGLEEEEYDPTKPYARIFADENTGMLADVVFASWITDLRPDSTDPAAANQVLPLHTKDSSKSAEQVFWDHTHDPADWQHVTTYTIGLGVAGNVNYPDGTWTDNGSTRTLQANGFPGNWNTIGMTGSSASATLVPSAVKIDDSWHAGINGRGGYLSAGDPAALIKAFSDVLDAIGTLAKDSSAAAAAVNTGSTASQDVVYQARLNSAGWSGDVRAYQVSAGKGKAPCPGLNVLAGQLCQDPSKGEYFKSAADAMREITPSDRRIFTAVAAVGKEFIWNNLSDIQKLDFLRGAGFTGTDLTTPSSAPSPAQSDEAQARLAYVTGDRTYEEVGEKYRFRTRPLLTPCTEPPCTNLLGDFINSAPVLVGAPAFYYNAPGYQSAAGTHTTGFKQRHQNRTPLVYAGANDGMLHAFDAGTLQETFAFIPPVLMGLTGVSGTQVQRPGLHVLSDPAYGGNAKHRNFVDGPIVTGDVRFGSADQGDWHTVLIGALGLGAQALYALDVTDPQLGHTTPQLAESLYHWQFTDRDATPNTMETLDPADLGYVFGRPAIVRMRGTGGAPVWVAITGNGYNSSEDDGSRNTGCDNAAVDTGNTACGQAVLYVIEIETGQVIKKFSTGVGRKDDPLYPAAADADKRRSNALGQPTVVAESVHTDGDLLADYAYAADLFGNIYRFDLTGTSTKPIRTLFSAVGPAAGTTAGSAQPITSPVAVARHPLGLGTLVLFGTGKYLEVADAGDRQIQSFYAIWDLGSDDQAKVQRSTLLEQSFSTTEIVVNDGDGAEVTRGRTSSTNRIDWRTHLGWYIDFKETGSTINKGERVATEPEVQGGRVIFVSLVPESNPCVGGGYSWINALDLRNGGRLGLTPFDFNLDGSIGEADLLTISGEQVVGSSVRLTPGGESTGIYSSPSSFGDGAGRITTVVSTSEGDLVLINAADIQAWRVWQQLR